MNRAIKRANRRLLEMGVRVLHDATADVFYLSEMYGPQKIGSYSRTEFFARWCGSEEFFPPCTAGVLS